MTDSFVGFLKKQEVKYYSHLDISKISSIGIGGRARLAIFPGSEEEFIKIIDFLTNEKIKYRLVGRMTNILPCDEDYSGALISSLKMSSYSRAENRVYAECGVSTSRLLSELSALSLGGCEELFGIPGSVGGMIYSNAGAFGREISDVCESVRLYLPKEKRVITATASDMDFAYRSQKYKGSDAVILGATLTFSSLDTEEIKARHRDFIRRRREAQPYGEKSLGSIFKRHGSAPTSRLIDELGLKGYRIGGAEISKKHAGFIVNVGGASSLDVKLLINKIKNEIYAKHGFIPEEEIEYL